MLKLLIRLLVADAGSILFRGEEITQTSEERMRTIRQNIAMLFQGAALFDSLSVGDNVGYGLREHFRETMSAEEMKERVHWALSLGRVAGHRSDAACLPLGGHEEAGRLGSRDCGEARRHSL